MARQPIVIVGAGPAGCATAVQCRRLGRDVRLLDQTGRAGGLLVNAHRIENYLGLPPLSGPEFAERIADHLQRWGITVAQATIEEIAPEADGFRMQGSLGELRARYLILATGTRPKHLPIEGESRLRGQRLFYEVHELLRVIPQPRRVLVIGGGDAACDYALTLAARGARVTILSRGRQLRACPRLLDEIQRVPAIDVLRPCRLAAIQSVDGRVRAAVEPAGDGGAEPRAVPDPAADGQGPEPAGPAVSDSRAALLEALDADALLVAIGRVSRLPEFFPGLANTRLPAVQGPVAGLFVIGDARTGALGQAGIAVGDGLTAAAALDGRRRGATEPPRPHPPHAARSGAPRQSAPSRKPAATDDPPLTILHSHGEDDLARVYVAATGDGSRIECVESVQPPVPREEKWVLIVSTLKGCPIGCPFCDAGGDYRGRLSAEEIFGQIDHLIRRRYPDGRVPTPKLKIQFARMGDPALNDAVLEVLDALPGRFEVPGLMPCLSTIAPRGREAFFERLREIKQARYGGGRFQLQFSIHTTDPAARRRLIPAPTWSLAEIGAYVERFRAPGDRKVTLNFAPARGLALEPDRLPEHFDPEHVFIKLTPINPTRAAARAGLTGLIDPLDGPANDGIAERFRRAGYETLLSIGELRENRIGSNCGMYAAGSSEP